MDEQLSQDATPPTLDRDLGGEIRQHRDQAESFLSAFRKRIDRVQSQLADQLEIEKSTAGRLIDHMEHNGWVERRPILGDRRSRSVHLTDKARPLIARIEEIILKTREESLRGLTDDDQRVLSAAVETMKTNLRAILDEDR